VTAEPLLSVRDLRTYFPTRKGLVKAVDGVSFELDRGDTLGIVGESGSGKSITALSIVGLVPPPGRNVSGEVIFEGKDLLKASEFELRRVRGRRIGFIFQDPMVSLNPVMTIGDQITESLEIHTKLRGGDARKRAISLLDMVGIPSPERRVDNYPHEFSGGMRQRAMIAIAIACDPALLLADEPSTALDVTIQAQILELLKNLQRELGMALILISHDLGVVAEMCRRIMVMYAGRRAELAQTRDLLRSPAHPYTRGLLASRPGLHRAAPIAGTGNGMSSNGHRVRVRLQPIPGMPPDLSTPIPGCAFAPRCTLAEDHCANHQPAFEQVAEDHWAACWVAQREAAGVS
jgi:oligopeptide/dipeptide ABC transporter ATP-binding protein